MGLIIYNLSILNGNAIIPRCYCNIRNIKNNKNNNGKYTLECIIQYINSSTNNLFSADLYQEENDEPYTADTWTYLYNAIKNKFTNDGITFADE